MSLIHARLLYVGTKVVYNINIYVAQITIYINLYFLPISHSLSALPHSPLSAMAAAMVWGDGGSSISGVNEGGGLKASGIHQGSATAGPRAHQIHHCRSRVSWIHHHRASVMWICQQRALRSSTSSSWPVSVLPCPSLSAPHSCGSTGGDNGKGGSSDDDDGNGSRCNDGGGFSTTMTAVDPTWQHGSIRVFGFWIYGFYINGFGIFICFTKIIFARERLKSAPTKIVFWYAVALTAC